MSGGLYRNSIDDHLAVPREDELYLRNHWKLLASVQFLNLFKNLFRFKDPAVITPFDLEQSLLRPQHDSLCSELMTKLLHRKGVNWAANDGEVLEYDQWCMQLAKKFNGMYKAYRKFSVRYLGVDPSEKEGGDAMEETKEQPKNAES